MADIPADVEEAIKTIEEFRATATPGEQQALERARAEVSGDAQQLAMRRQNAQLAGQIESDYPHLAEALRSGTDIETWNTPAVSQALTDLRNKEELERQRDELTARIEQLEVSTEANLAGANAVLEVKAKQEKTALANRDKVQEAEG